MTGVVIVGAGLAAVRTAEQLRRNDYAGAITIVGAEPRAPYDRPPLSKELLRGEVDEVPLKPAQFYTEQAITLRLGCAARSVDAAARTITLTDGAVLGYEQLVIATGLAPRRITAWPELAGVHVLRSLDDALALRAHAATAGRAVVVGAGFIGCEVTAALRRRGLDVVLVEPQSAPLESVLGTRVGALVARLHRRAGVDVRTGVGVAALHGAAAVSEVTLTDGTALPADLVVVGIGSRPVTGWLTGSGIEVDPVDHGVVCDAHGRSSAAGVWAIGDVASWQDRHGRQVRLEHWSNVAEQARTLAAALLGRACADRPVVPYLWSDQYDVKIQCLGRPQPGDVAHLVHDDGADFLAYYERDGVLVGVAGAGLPEAVRAARAAIAAGVPIGDVLAAAV